MFEGQQTVEAIFRFPEGKRIKNVGVIEFDRNGVFHFVGSPEVYEGVRNLLAYHGVKPDRDPLEGTAIIPATLKTGDEPTPAKAVPPADDYSDLDDLSDIKELKAKANVQADPATAAASDSGQSPVQRDPAGASTGEDIRHGSGSGADAGAAEGAASGSDDQLRPKAEVTAEEAEDFDFS